MTNEQDLFGRGVYTASEAAALSGLRSDRLSRWLRGYGWKNRRTGRKGSSRPIFTPDGRGEGRLTLSFLDLVEVLFVKAFLQHGVSLPTIRCAASEGAKMFGTAHPFCLRRFETDGRSIFVRVADEVDDEKIYDLVSKQAEFRDVVRPLFKQLDYNVAEVASTWWPRGRDVPIVVDPARSFGSPIVAERGIPTHVLAGPVEAGESIEAVARWFAVSIEEVRAAVDFERSLKAA